MHLPVVERKPRFASQEDGSLVAGMRTAPGGFLAHPSRGGAP